MVEEGEEMKINLIVEEIQTGEGGDSGSVEDPGEICVSLALPIEEEQAENNKGRLLRTPSEKSRHSSDGTESSKKFTKINGYIDMIIFEILSIYFILFYL